MVWFGDIDIPIVSNKDTDVSIVTIDTDFVDNPPRSYKLYSTLESGTYEFFLNQDIHQKNETLKEQKDAVLSMVNRHATEFPVEGGFVSLNTVNHTTTPSEMVDEVSASLHYLDYPEYTLGYKVNSYSESETLSVSDISYIGIPDVVDVVGESPSFSFASEDGLLQYYPYEKTEMLEVDFPTFDSEVERVSPCRCFSGSRRVYSKGEEVNSFTLKNGVVRVDEDTSALQFYFYDSGWVNVASIPFDYNVGYTTLNENKSIELSLIDSDDLRIYRSLPFIKQKQVTGSVEFNTDIDSVLEQTDEYIVALTLDGYEAILLRSENKGVFNSNSSGIYLDNVISPIDVYYGVVPDSVSREEVKQMALARGRIKRTFV